MVAELNEIDEIKCRSVCLIPNGNAKDALISHEYDYCRCDINVLLKENENLKKQIKKLEQNVFLLGDVT